MKQKSIVRVVLYCLVALMLVANATSVAASPELTQSSGKVFTVSPNPGGDDTANIQHAFDQAVKAGPGSTVKLTAGNFHTRFIEVWKFDGTFKGAGQDLTIIDTFADQDCQARIDQDRTPALFNFFQGNVRVSDLGFHITPTAPCKPYLFGGFSQGTFTWISILAITPSPFVPTADCAVVQKERVSGSITRVTFRGKSTFPQNSEADPMNSNIGEPILMGGSYPTKDLWTTDCTFFLKFAQGTFSVTDTIIQKTLEGIVLEYTYNSLVRISGNTFDLGTNGIILENSSGSLIDISANHVKRGSWSGIWVRHGGVGKQPYIDTPAVYDVHDNDIEAFDTSGWATAGILGWDRDHMGNPYFTSAKTAVVSIRNNRIQLIPLNPPGPNPYPDRGVWLEGVEGSLTVNNKISGTGTIAIAAGFMGPSKRGLILGNNLTGFSSNTSSPYKIMLGSGTEKYVVVGEPVANVANFGTDNLIAGTKFQTLRQFAPDAMDDVMENMKNLKGWFHLGPH